MTFSRLSLRVSQEQVEAAVLLVKSLKTSAAASSDEKDERALASAQMAADSGQTTFGLEKKTRKKNSM